MSWINGFNITDGETPAPARKRFTTAQAVYDVFQHYRERDAKDGERRSRIKKIYNGNLPYDPADLRKAGQAWRTNMNFHALSSAIDARADAVSRLAVDTCSLVTLTSLTPESAGPDDERIATVVEEEFSRALRRDGRPIQALAMVNKEADLYGIGPATWRDPDDYVPLALERAQITFDPEGPANSSDHEIIFVDTLLPATTVFQVLDSPELAEKSGWNVPAVKRYAVSVFQNQMDTNSNMTSLGGVSMQEAAIEAFRRNDFFEAEQFKKFHVLRVYVREMKAPRKITEIIVPANNTGNLTNQPAKEFLFIRENAYDTMDQVFVWYTSSLSQRYARSLRGIASILAPISAAQDRVTCSVIDATMRAMSLVLQQKNPGATPLNTLQELGPYTVVGADLEPVPNANQMSNFQSAMQVRGMLDQLGPGSVAGVSMSPTMPRLQEGGDRQSKAETEILEHKRTQRDENHFASRMHVWDVIFSETFSRFIKIATGPKVIRDDYPYVVEFVKRCEARGVGQGILKELKDRFLVQTCRDLVVGSDGIVQFLSTTMASLSGNTDEAGRRAFSHDIVRYRLGQRAANRYMPVESRDSSPSNDASIATLENNCLQAQQPVLVGPDQRHFPHIRIHMQVLQQIQQQVEQGLAAAQQKVQTEGEGSVTRGPDGEYAPQIEDPERLAAVLQATSQHIQAHLQIFRMQINVAQMVKGIEQTLVGMAPTIKALNLAIDEQRRVREAEQEKQQRELEELQKRASEAELEKSHYEADRQAETERYKIDKMHEVELARIQMQGQEGQQRLAIESRERAQKGRLDYETARHDMSLRDQESRHGMDLASAEAESTARLRAAEAMSNRMEATNRVAKVTGRQAPRPSEFTEPQPAPGMIL